MTSTRSSVRTAGRRLLRPRFGLATLLVCCAGLCAVLAAGTAWYRSHEKEHARHVAIAEELRAHGATPTFTWQGPNWLTSAFEEWDVFRRVTDVHCSSTLTPKIVDGVRRLGSPLRLSVLRGLLNDEAVAELANLRNVSSILVNYVDFPPGRGAFVSDASPLAGPEASPWGPRHLAAVERDFAALQARLPAIEARWWINDP